MSEAPERVAEEELTITDLSSATVPPVPAAKPTPKAPDAKLAFAKNPTISDEIKGERMREEGKRGRVSATAPLIAEGLTPRQFPGEVGYHVCQPEELLTVKVPLLGLDSNGDAFIGYQRPLNMLRAFRIAWAAKKGHEMPNIQISLDEYGTPYITDGQHRIVNAIINRTPIEAVVKQRTYAQARQLFLDQFFAKKPDKSHLVLSGQTPMDRYVQDALTDSTHPWHNMVAGNSSPKRFSPSMARSLIIMYACNQVGNAENTGMEKLSRQFNKKRADELATLIGVFGRDPITQEFNRQNNSAALHGHNVRGLTDAAVQILIRADNIHPAADKERWMRHMVQFKWSNAQGESSWHGVSEKLLAHWNKRMSSRHVSRKTAS